nr:response regulator transcription factor [Methylomarinum sp. Ch1-1]MDP4523274.1 response regulator transcription factor [Methylomarinum sp. Ch1-1]
MTDSKSIRILLVDDHAVVREGYRSLLEKQPGMEVVAEAADGAEAYSCFKDCNPEIAVMDISMPGQGGWKLLFVLNNDTRMRRSWYSACTRIQALLFRQSGQVR